MSKQEVEPIVTEVLSTFSNRDKEIITLRFGLRDGKVHTEEEIGRTYKISSTNVARIEKIFLKRIREI